MSGEEGDRENGPESGTFPIESLRGNDSREWNRLLGLYRPYLTVLAAKLIPGPMQGRIDQSDLVQEAILRGLSERDQFRGSTEAEFSAWLKQILRNVAIDWVRHHTADKRDIRREAAEVEIQPSHSETPSQVYSKQEEFRRIASAMSKLPEDQRQAVEMRSKGMSFRDIGIAMDRSEDAARMLWGRGLARLIEIMESNGNSR